jgi:hypothetical protein
MSKAVKTLIAASLILALSGCVVAVGNRGEHTLTDRVERYERNRAAIDQLHLGSSIDAVIAELGQADFSESFIRDGQTYRLLYYRTHTARKDEGHKRGTTPLVFVHGELVGWGESALPR